MHKIVRRRQPWTCHRCLQSQSRSNSSVAAPAPAPIYDHSPYNTAYLNGSQKLQTDNALLRDVFNNKQFWRDFSTRAKTATGLIGNSILTKPRGFHHFAERCIQKCKVIVDRVLAASTVEEYKRLPRDLDRLSDLLCRVIDLSDFIRGIHPDQNIAGAATASYSQMFQYMNELNTTTGLNEQLQKAMSMPEVYSQWTQEEKIVAQILMKDFAKSGVDLPDKQREQFVSLSNEISEVGTDFTNRMDHASPYIMANKSQLDGIDPTYLKNMSSWKKTQIPMFSTAAKLVLNNAHDSSIRKDLYIAERTASKQTIARLETLILRRAKLAKLTGHETYGHMALADKMSKSPDSVMKFLQSLNKNNKGTVGAELDKLLQVKRTWDPSAQHIAAWEHPYLMNRYSQLQSSTSPRTSRSRLRESRNAYFALGNVIQGLSSLFESLYGVRLVPKETQLGEVWHPDVRRLDVYTDSQEHIATMYCDLFSRPGKLPNPAHYTLVCSREIGKDEIEENQSRPYQSHESILMCSEIGKDEIDSPQSRPYQSHYTLVCSREIGKDEIEETQSRNEPINDGMPTYTTVNSANGEVSHHQTPLIALVCDFNDSASALEPTLLSPHSVTTLFHEMGHAVHSILGRTTMQGIAGTRCATDFAELPSVLMEYFATNPAVLKLFARHWRTDQVIPDEMIATLAAEQKERAGKTGGWENENQILMAILDQEYHSRGPIDALEQGRYNSTDTFHGVWSIYGSAEEPSQTAWQGFFGHLYGYGSTYYSYLFDRAIARQVWRSVFKDGMEGAAIDRAAGEHFKTEVLRWGGGRDPWQCLEGLMGDGKGVLGEGGDEAMNLVGGWGVGASEEGMM